MKARKKNVTRKRATPAAPESGIHEKPVTLGEFMAERGVTPHPRLRDVPVENLEAEIVKFEAEKSAAREALASEFREIRSELDRIDEAVRSVMVDVHDVVEAETLRDLAKIVTASWMIRGMTQGRVVEETEGHADG